ncbi:MAG: DNA-protecting protein DprA [Planctomycetota bacterium]|nr:MAG: DNA-protecting protein DprA [Planctomycetota bacterium]
MGRNVPTPPAAPIPPDDAARDVLRLTLIPGLGPVRIARLIEAFGSAGRVLGASESALTRVRGVGRQTAQTIARQRDATADRVERELDLARSLGVRLLALGDRAYPPLLAAIPNPPPILYVRGEIDQAQDRFPVAIVGSRGCSAYGVEQAERFAGWLASAGLTVVSGGARGVDTAAHRAAVRLGGRTIAVLGSGLAEPYPPENRPFFDEVASGRGAVVSELPLTTPPAAENFPMRNRIISGLSLGVLIVEAAVGSGALITARHATEDHGREVMALPGRVDSPASAGANDLLKRGGAHLVTDPKDVLDLLESPARHLHAGVHAARYADPARARPEPGDDPDAPGDHDGLDALLTDQQRAIVAALDRPMVLDELARRLGLPAERLLTEVTVLEIRGRVARVGSTLTRRDG